VQGHPFRVERIARPEVRGEAINAPELYQSGSELYGFVVNGKAIGAPQRCDRDENGPEELLVSEAGLPSLDLSGCRSVSDNSRTAVKLTTPDNRR
jgi:hypothetical protein